MLPLNDGILLSISIASIPLDLSCCFSLRMDSSVSLKTITFWLGCFVLISSTAVASLFSAEASSPFLFLTFRNQAFACQLGKPPCLASSIIGFLLLLCQVHFYWIDNWPCQASICDCIFDKVFSSWRNDCHDYLVLRINFINSCC